MPCPVCDHNDLSVQALLSRLDDLDTIITLSCDFAERVVGQAQDPSEAARWLAIAHKWRDNPNEVRVVTEAARAWSPKTAARQGREAWAAGNTMLWATAAAGMAGTAGASARALEKTAKYAALATLDEAAEGKWQLAHARKLACICNPPMPPEFFESRSRNSSLAS